jgi:splicing factor 3B subunit 4
VGNLDAAATEALVWELFAQAGPVASVYLPKDRVSGAHQGYGFVEFGAPVDADYAARVLNMVRLFGKPLRVTKAGTAGGGGEKGGLALASAASSALPAEGVGANLFIGGLDPDVDEKLLYDTFSAFGAVLGAPKVARDPETGTSKGYGFVSFDSFEASDAAAEAMDGQFLGGRPIAVQYAFKKDATRGERHGTPAERLLAEQARLAAKAPPVLRPHTRFATGPGGAGMAGGGGVGDEPPPPPPPPDDGYGPPPPPPPLPPHMMGGPMPPGGVMMPPPPPMWGGGGGGPMMPPPPPPGWGMGMPPPPPPGYWGGGPPPPPPPPPPPGWGPQG